MFWWSRGQCISDTRLDGKTVIVTGSNTGIGKATALELCKRGARVIMACRSLERANVAGKDIQQETAQVQNSGQVVVKELDLSSLKSVRRCAEDILATEEHIHILVNNAGDVKKIQLFHANPSESLNFKCHCQIRQSCTQIIACCTKTCLLLTEDGHELQFGTNHLGHFLFTLLLLPRLIKSAPSRIVNISSSAHAWGTAEMHFNDINAESSYSRCGAYVRSKLANVLFTKQLAKKMKGSGVTTYCVDPGYVHTQMYRNFDISAYTYAVIDFAYKCRIINFILSTPLQGAQTILHCCLDDEAGKENGLYYRDCKPCEVGANALDVGKAKQLWDYSWDAVGLPKDYEPYAEG